MNPTEREKALFDALWQLIGAIDAIDDARCKGTFMERIQRAQQDAEAYSQEFPGENDWCPPQGSIP